MPPSHWQSPRHRQRRLVRLDPPPERQEAELTRAAVRHGAVFVQTESVSGDDTGRDAVSCTLVTKQGLALCRFALSLKEGQIIGYGLVQLGSPGFETAITGGTGKWKDARGTITVKNTSETRTDYTVNVD